MTNWKNERKKLKEMSINDRLWYLWAYYKIPLLACIFVLFVLFETGAWIYRNLQSTMFYCVVINEPNTSSSAIASIQSEFESRNGFDKNWRQTTEFDCSMAMGATSEELSDFFYSSASTIKLESLVATNSIDVLITVPVMADYYKDQNLYMDLTTLLPSNLYEQLDKEGRILINDSVAYGILLDDTLIAKKLYLEDGSVLSVCTDQNSPEFFFDFISYAVLEK